jgi:hypothetical protein
MSKTRVKPGPGRHIEQLHPQKAEEVEPPQIEQEPVTEKPAASSQWWNKPRLVQFNLGRFEFSLPYQVVIAIVLGLILLVLIAYRLGQMSMVNRGTAGQVEVPRNNVPANTGTETGTMQPAESTTVGRRGSSPVSPAKPMGHNVIVLAEYGAKADLVPVQKHFAEYGVETGIVIENGRYYLQTVDAYDDFTTAGARGYEALQKIIKIGDAYRGRAPEGYETFAPHYFSDAYGKKVR